MRLGIPLVQRESPLAESDDVFVFPLIEQDVGHADQGWNSFRVLFQYNFQFGFRLLVSSQLDITGRQDQQGLRNHRLLQEGRFNPGGGFGILFFQDQFAGRRNGLENTQLVLGGGQRPSARRSFRRHRRSYVAQGGAAFPG